MIVVGNKDPNVSNFRKAWISDGETTVKGIFGPGTSREITANWSSPFEGESLGAKNQLTGGAMQGVVTDGLTMVTTLNSLQVWEGNRPTAFTLELMLYALEDPELEVMQPLRALEFMIAPDTFHASPFGRIPNSVQLNIGSKIIYNDVVIESVSTPFDKEMDSQGRFVRATVNIQLSSKTMVSKDMLKNKYGISSDSKIF